ncbi:hypothetical protein ACFYON_03415 [Micromonospora sp. NPDC005686]|uniref:hypothetical protein n=1 Tax=unclassified Micromonospora TaxID=2617518 RepID=UPI0036B1BE32
MAEDDIARTGIRVGGWLPTPDEPADGPERPVGPRRLPGDTQPSVPRSATLPDRDRPPADPDEPVPAGDLEPPGTAVWPPPRTPGAQTHDLPTAGPLPADTSAPGPSAAGAFAPNQLGPGQPGPGRLAPGTLPAGPVAPNSLAADPVAPGPLASGQLAPGQLARGPLLGGASPPVGPEPRPSPPAGRVPLVGPAPIGLHLSAPSPVRAGTAHTPAEPADLGALQEADAEARSGRHSARESVPARLADLTGGIGVRLRAAVRAAKTRLSRSLAPIADPLRHSPEAPATRVATARARRRRRRSVLAAVAVTGLVAALTYAVRSPAPPPLTGATAPAAAPSGQAPGVPVTGDPGSPGRALLDVDLAPLPSTVSLTALGTRDWRHWGGDGADSFHRKVSGTGEIQDPGGERLEHNAGASDLQWTDGTPTAAQAGTRAGVFQRGAGRSFTLGVAGSGDLRTVRLFVGTFSAGARLDLSLSGGGDPVVREVALAAGDRFYQYVVRFRAPQGERLLIRWRALTVTGGQNDGVALQAITVS